MIRRLLVPAALAGVLAACGGGDDAAPASVAPDPTVAAEPSTTTADGQGSATGDDATGDDATGDGATGDGATGDDATGDDATGDGATDGAVVADVPAALQFTAPLVGGGEIEMATLAGRPVLLWFWAPW